jgi:hypothetical protein
LLARSRFFVEKYKDCIDYCKDGLKKFPTNLRLKELMKQAEDEVKKESKRIDEI